MRDVILGTEDVQCDEGDASAARLLRSLRERPVVTNCHSHLPSAQVLSIPPRNPPTSQILHAHPIHDALPFLGLVRDLTERVLQLHEGRARVCSCGVLGGRDLVGQELDVCARLLRRAFPARPRMRGARGGGGGRQAARPFSHAEDCESENGGSVTAKYGARGRVGERSGGKVCAAGTTRGQAIVWQGAAMARVRECVSGAIAPSASKSCDRVSVVFASFHDATQQPRASQRLQDTSHNITSPSRFEAECAPGLSLNRLYITSGSNV